MSKRAVRSPTEASPRLRDSKIARRLGSASARKILSSTAMSLCMPTHKRLLMSQSSDGRSKLGTPKAGADTRSVPGRRLGRERARWLRERVEELPRADDDEDRQDQHEEE